MRRPFAALATLGTAAHHTYELSAGVGLVLQPYIGLPGSLAFWGASLPGLLYVSARGDDRWDAPLAFAGGTALAGAAVHYTIWPWSWRRGLPWLDEAEGLSPSQVPAYNVILYTWFAAALLSLLREVDGKKRRWALAGLMMGVPLRASAKHHFHWAAEEAKTHPAWWNRGLR